MRQVRTLIVDALRHWAAEYDVDGFCFVNAENMAQGAPTPVPFLFFSPYFGCLPALLMLLRDRRSSCMRAAGMEGSLLHVHCHVRSRAPGRRTPCACPLAADRHGMVLDNPPLPEEIALDPVLGALKLIAWSGDDALLPRGGARGAPCSGRACLCRTSWATPAVVAGASMRMHRTMRRAVDLLGRWCLGSEGWVPRN